MTFLTLKGPEKVLHLFFIYLFLTYFKNLTYGWQNLRSAHQLGEAVGRVSKPLTPGQKNGIHSIFSPGLNGVLGGTSKEVKDLLWPF